MKIFERDFLPEEKIYISADSWFIAGRLYGKKMEHISKQRLDMLSKTLSNDQRELTTRIPAYYDEFRHLIDSQIFSRQSINWLGCYSELLNGFSQGSGLSILDCVRLQVLDTMGCQTLITKERSTQKTIILHMEEDFGEKTSVYDYRMVTVHVGALEYSFFCYPGALFGGSTMGINVETNTFIAADSLYTRCSAQVDHRLWTNALAAVLFMVGDIRQVKKLVSRLKQHRITGIAGSALHFVQKDPHGTTDIYSLEFCDGGMSRVSMKHRGDRDYIAQPNYPFSQKCRAIDSLHAPVATMDLQVEMSRQEMQRRVKRLSKWATLVPFSLSTLSETAQYLSALCHYSPSDSYEVSGRKEETGFMNDYVAAYAFGMIDSCTEEIMMGKLLPTFDASSPWSKVVRKQSQQILSGRFLRSSNDSHQSQ